MSLVHYYAGSDAETIAAAFDYDLVVTGAVASVANIPATNADPPLATIKIDEILHGKSPGNQIRVIWEPFPHDVDYNTPEREPRYQVWANAPMVSPAVGEQYVLMLDATKGDSAAGDYSCRNICRFPLSSDAVQGVARGLEKRAKGRLR